MKQKILVVSLIVVLLIGAVATPINVLATDKKGNDDKKDSHDDDDHKTHNSCQNIPKETPFRDLWIFVCSLQTQIDQINDKLNQLSTGGGGSSGTGSNCPVAQNIDLSSAVLTLQNLAGCNLSNAKIGSADMRFVNLKGANLSGADLSGSLLNNANLAGANLVGTNFQFATLTGADLTGATTDATTNFHGSHGPCIGNSGCSNVLNP